MTRKNGLKIVEVMVLSIVCFIVGLFICPVKAEAASGLQLTFEFADGTKKTWESSDDKLDFELRELAYIYFGSYPQTEVTGKELTTKITGAKYDKSGVATVNGVKYRRISKSDATYVSTSYSYGAFNWSGKEYAYFRYEPIKWRVLSNLGGQVLLLAENALDCQRYNSEAVNITWAESSLRTWLNKAFLSAAFSASEKKFLSKTKVVTPDTVSYSIITEGGKDTNDKVFVPSYEDLVNVNYGFCRTRSIKDTARCCAATDFANARGVTFVNDKEYVTSEGKASCSWPLRSPGMVGNKIYAIRGNGIVDIDYSVYSCFGIRPAITLDLKSVIVLPNAKKDAKKTKIVLEYTDGTKQAWTNGDEQIMPEDKELAYVYYGSYPQTGLTAYELTPSIVNAKYNKNGVAIVAGIKYKRITKEDTIGIDENDNMYEQWGDKEYAYFIYEPIKWMVLSNDKGCVTLLSEYGLSNNRYNEELSDCSWATATLRLWLNKTFIADAFNSKERKLIKTTGLKNDDNPEYGTDGGADTKDKLFLLSYSDIYNQEYGFITGVNATTVKNACIPTMYARTLGCRSYYSSQVSENQDIPCSNWWLRTVGYDKYYALIRGSVTREKVGEGVLNPNAVRPAMVLNLTKVIG